MSAGDWYFTPDARLSSEYNDNPLLLIDGGESAWGTITEVDLGLNMRSENQVFRVDTRFSNAEYDSRDALDYEDTYLDLVDQLFYQRSQWRFALSYADQSTRTSELLDSGRVQFRIPVQTLSLEPSGVIFLSQRDQLNIAFAGSEVEYEDGLASGFVDYRYTTLNVTWQRDIGLNTNIQAGLYSSRYDAQVVERTIDTVGLDVGFNNKLTERLTLNTRLGVRETESETPLVSGGVFSETDNGQTLDVSVDYAFTRSALSASISRSLSPSSFGVINERDEVGFGLETRLNTGLSTSLRLIYFQNDAITESAFVNDDDDRLFGQLIAGFRWDIGRNWWLSGRYRYYYQEFDSTEDADSNLFRITFGYNVGR